MDMIKLDHVSFRYDQQRDVLKDISFTIKQGQYVALMGHNGSGKSTLAKLLAGLLELKQGTIVIDQLLLSPKYMKDIRKKLGIVFQNPDNQFIGATVADDIAFGLENRQIPSNQMQGLIDRYASQVGMKDFLHQEPSSLSGGQKQRVAMAGVLAMQPKILLLDEATAMLDPKGKTEIRDLILELRTSFPALTIIAITHDVEEVMLADEVLVLKDGMLAYQGLPFALFKDQALVQSLHLNLPFAFQLLSQLSTHKPTDLLDMDAWAKSLWR